MDNIPSEKPIPVAVIGCGLIGASWTALFLEAGHDVQAWDPAEGTRETFGERRFQGVCVRYN